MSNTSVTLSAAIMVRRHAYYDHLESAQKSSLDIMSWLLWFLDTLKEALEQGINARKYQSLA